MFILSLYCSQIIISFHYNHKYLSLIIPYERAVCDWEWRGAGVAFAGGNSGAVDRAKFPSSRSSERPWLGLQ